LARYILVIAAGVALAACQAAAAGEQAHPTAAQLKFKDQAHNAEVAARVQAWDTAVWNNAVWNNAVWANAVAENEAIAAQQAADAAAWAAAHRPAPHQNPTAAPRATSTGACGGAGANDQFIGRESGGNPNAQNPSGAYGCYQILPSTWAGSCSDLGAEIGSSASTQAQCASRLSSSNWTCCEGKP
jgi:hypothetical protein